MYREWKSGGSGDGHLGRNDKLRTVDVELLEDPTHLLLGFSVGVDLGILSGYSDVNLRLGMPQELKKQSEKDSHRKS